MSYKVVKYFEDKNDKLRPYYPGDKFPRKGLKVSKERYEELSTKKNALKAVLIVKEG